MHRPPRLIAKLLAHAAATRGEGLRDVAAAIGIDETTLMQYRSGRRRLSMETYANILNVYGEDRAITDAALHYARVEYHPSKPDSIEAATDALPVHVVEILRTYVDRLPQEAVTMGRGLYLASLDARALSSAVQFLVRAFERSNVATLRLRADQRLSAAERRAGLAAPVLIVERIDFMRDPLPELLRERANIIRPMLVTSMRRPETTADPHLRRVFLSLTRLIDLDPPSSPPHGSLPAAAETEQPASAS